MSEINIYFPSEEFYEQVEEMNDSENEDDWGWAACEEDVFFMDKDIVVFKPDSCTIGNLDTPFKLLDVAIGSFEKIDFISADSFTNKDDWNKIIDRYIKDLKKLKS